MFLLNCKSCDDVLRLVNKVRTCECGKSQGRLEPVGELPRVEGPHARLIKIHWEQYDSAIEGELKTWFLCYPGGDVTSSQESSNLPSRGRGKRL